MRKSLSIVLALRPMPDAISRWVQTVDPMLAGRSTVRAAEAWRVPPRRSPAFACHQSRSGPGSFAAESDRRSPSPDHSTGRGAVVAPPIAGGRSSGWSRRGTGSCAAKRSAPELRQQPSAKAPGAGPRLRRRRRAREDSAATARDFPRRPVANHREPLPGLRASIAACRQAQIDERLSWGPRA